MGMISFPLQSNFLHNDEYGNPIYDRAVDSIFYRTFWRKYFTDGIFYDPADNFKVIAIGDMKLSVKLGECHIRGVTAAPDEESTEILNISPASPAVDRTDRIVIRADFDGERSVTVQVREDWKPTDKLTRNADVWELAIADVLVRKSTVSVAQVNITDLRLNTELCGIVTEPITRVNTSVFFDQIESEYSLIQNEWDLLKTHYDNEWGEQMEEQEDGYVTAIETFTEWFSQAVADPANYFQRNFDNPSMYPGCSLFTEAVSKTLTVQEIRTGTEESGALIASRHITKTGIGENTEIDYSFYNIDGEVIFSCTEHYERLSSTKTKNYVELGG